MMGKALRGELSSPVTGLVVLLPFSKGLALNPLYTSGVYHCHVLNESICHLMGVGSIL